MTSKDTDEFTIECNSDSYTIELPTQSKSIFTIKCLGDKTVIIRKSGKEIIK